MTVYQELANILIDDYAVSPEAIEPTVRLETLGIDSLGVMELLFKIEDTFHINVPTEQNGIQTLQELSDYIDRLIIEQSNPPASNSSSLNTVQSNVGRLEKEVSTANMAEQIDTEPSSRNNA